MSAPAVRLTAPPPSRLLARLRDLIPARRYYRCLGCRRVATRRWRKAPDWHVVGPWSACGAWLPIKGTSVAAQRARLRTWSPFHEAGAGRAGRELPAVEAPFTPAAAPVSVAMEQPAAGPVKRRRPFVVARIVCWWRAQHDRIPHPLGCGRCADCGKALADFDEAGTMRGGYVTPPNLKR